jgi:hypothetical protein
LRNVKMTACKALAALIGQKIVFVL